MNSRICHFKNSLFLFAFFLLSTTSLRAAYLLLPMDDTQKNHLKAYGIAFWVLQKEVEVDWLL
ncbi:MAG: asparagine synthetase B, partial [Bacteroidetes bacterium]|nr:asparagine synthetase B [Bacteroidota bacterium]